jgi:hypothetical protein
MARPAVSTISENRESEERADSEEWYEHVKLLVLRRARRTIRAGVMQVTICTRVHTTVP